MVERRDCHFCGNPIEPGTGKLFVKRDGTRFHFCTNTCQKNLLVLKRTPRKVRWTRFFPRAGAQPAATSVAGAETAPSGKRGGKSASAKAQKFVS
ncbi:MAG: 50S ribosomal protein L24e [Methanobacteriota archaeon]